MYITMITKSLTQREISSMTAAFWERVDKDGPIPEHMEHLGKCWTWKGTDTYGVVRSKEGTQFRAHRFSFLLHFGDPGSMLVLHMCDNPSCVNPSHLRAGTVGDNVHDLLQKQKVSGKSKTLDDRKSTLFYSSNHNRAQIEFLSATWGVSKSESIRMAIQIAFDVESSKIRPPDK